MRAGAVLHGVILLQCGTRRAAAPPRLLDCGALFARPPPRGSRGQEEGRAAEYVGSRQPETDVERASEVAHLQGHRDTATDGLQPARQLCGARAGAAEVVGGGEHVRALRGWLAARSAASQGRPSLTATDPVRSRLALASYAAAKEAAPEGSEYTLHDGPPYANGDLHIGHALNKGVAVRAFASVNAAAVLVPVAERPLLDSQGLHQPLPDFTREAGHLCSRLGLPRAAYRAQGAAVDGPGGSQESDAHQAAQEGAQLRPQDRRQAARAVPPLRHLGRMGGARPTHESGMSARCGERT
eukprot:scaffold1562_cov323-Prasinococcus_capsulatus_cf.AAC.2